MICFIYTIFFLYYIVIAHAYLTGQQKQYIKNIIQNPHVPTEIKNKTKQIIAVHYVPWVLAEYNTFIGKHHKYLYKNQVLLNDLRQYAFLGMIKALVNYDSSVDFTIYAKTFVLGSLHQGVTKLLPLHPISHSNRLKGAKLPPITFTNENIWMFDKLGKHPLANPENDEDVILSLNSNIQPYISRKQEIDKIKKIVAREPPHIIRMFYYRYSKYTLEEIRTIETVSSLMDYSSETYRKHMNKLMKKIKAEISPLDFVNT
jgi:ferritin-like protein